MRNNISKLALTAALMLAITFTFSCSDDSGSGGGNQPNINSGAEISSSSIAGGNSSSSSKGNSSSSNGSEVVGSVKKDKISGFSQKGPFVKGSTASLYELDDKFVQTGRSFKDIIADDKGSFDIKINVELVSPYAMLETDGYYRNEVTGNISTGTIKLYAIADIREKSNVNVNILTHLEYYRVQKLVEAGKSLQAAKKQAQKEILSVFGITGEFKDSDDMSIFGTTDADAALLAISILLQGELTEGQFTGRLADFNLGFRETGTWDNKEEKKAIVDWVATEGKKENGFCRYFKENGNECWPMPTGDMCASGTLVNTCFENEKPLFARIRDNILGWNLSSSVPDFEKYVNNYWNAYYFGGACDAKKAGEIKDGPSGKKYICKDNAWTEASYVEIKCSESKCLTFTDARDNQSYVYVKIGEQTWMSENNNYNASGSKCYKDSTAYCDLYGRLYNWETAMKACPAGWHLPSNDEWQELVDFAGDNAGKKLKATYGWNDNEDKSGNGTDYYGFSALPGGVGGSARGSVGGSGYWWSSTEGYRYVAYFRYMNNLSENVFNYDENVSYGNDGKGSLYSVRCLQD